MRTNETVVNEYSDINVVVNYFHITKDGKRNSKYTQLPCGWLHAKVRVSLLEHAEPIDDSEHTLNKVRCQFYVNDELIGELIEVSFKEINDTRILKCAVAITRD